MTIIKALINIIAIYIKNIIDIIVNIIIHLLQYIQGNINIYLDKHKISKKQKLVGSGYGLLYSAVQILAIYAFLPCAGLYPLYSFCLIYALETLSFMGVIKQMKLKNKRKWLYYFLKYGKIT